MGASSGFGFSSIGTDSFLTEDLSFSATLSGADSGGESDHDGTIGFWRSWSADDGYDSTDSGVNGLVSDGSGSGGGLTTISYPWSDHAWNDESTNGGEHGDQTSVVSDTPTTSSSGSETSVGSPPSIPRISPLEEATGKSNDTARGDVDEAAPGGSTWVDQILFRGSRPGTFAYGAAGEYGYVYVLRSAGDHSFVLHTFDLDTYPTSAGGSVDSLVAGASAYYRRPTLQPGGTDESTLNVRTGGGTWKGLTAEELARLDGFLLGVRRRLRGLRRRRFRRFGRLRRLDQRPAGGSSLDSGSSDSSGDGAKLGEPVLSRMAAILAGLGATETDAGGGTSGTSRFGALAPALDGGTAPAGDNVQHAGDSVDSPGLLSTLWSNVSGAALTPPTRSTRLLGSPGPTC